MHISCGILHTFGVTTYTLSQYFLLGTIQALRVMP